MRIGKMAVLIFLGLLSWESFAGYATGGFTMEYMDQKSPNAACKQIQPYLHQGSLSCTENNEKVKAYSAGCLGRRIQYKAQPREALFALHAFYNMIFDRELMLLYRLKPVKNYTAQWDAFEAKWRLRLKNHPELLQIDQSPELVAASRGSLMLRLNSLASKRAEADALDQKYSGILGIQRGPGFYGLVGGMMIQILDESNYAKQEFLRNAGGDETLAKDNMTAERDFLLMAFPEFEKHPGWLTHWLVFLDRARFDYLDWDRYGKEMMKPGAAGRFLTFDERFDQLAKYLNSTFVEGSDVDKDFLDGIDLQFVYVVEEGIRDLDASVDQAFNNPRELLNSSFVIGVTLAELDDTDMIMKQDLTARQCTRIYEDANWKFINDLNKEYGGWILTGTTVVMLFGGAEMFVGWAALKVIGSRLIGQALFTGMGRMGGMVLVRAGTVLSAVGVPSSGFAIVEYHREYQQMAKVFYQNPNFDSGVRASALANGREKLGAETRSLFMYLAPLLIR